MDILKKMFNKNGRNDEKSQSKDDFRKPSIFEDYETDDDDLFDSNRKLFFQLLSPFELQKYVDEMQDILKHLKEYEEESGQFDKNMKDEYVKPGFEENFFKEFRKNKTTIDSDLDGEIYVDQLQSFLHRLSPEVQTLLPENNKILKPAAPKEKLTDSEKIMAIIHGTIEEEPQQIRRKEVIVPKLPPHFGGVFEGTYQGPKMFGQSIMTQVIRRPDGSYESKKIVRDTDGNVKTTITRNIDGKIETITSYDKGNEKKPAIEQSDSKCSLNRLTSDRNIYVSKDGYALPKNIW